jgi:hypothetical protein
MSDDLSHKDQPQNYLWVEGSGDIHVFRSLLNYHQIISNSYKEDRRFPVVHESKARLHTWLAWQKNPGKSMGLSITSKYVLPDCPLALQLIDWFRNLFEL